MLEIKPSTELKQVAEYCKKCGKAPGEEFYLYIAVNADKQLAACLFEVGGEAVTVLYYDCGDENDYWLFDGMLRSGFNYAFEQGINSGRIPEPFRIKFQRFFSKLNYPISTDFDITNFFNKYKNCRLEA